MCMPFFPSFFLNQDVKKLKKRKNAPWIKERKNVFSSMKREYPRRKKNTVVIPLLSICHTLLLYQNDFLSVLK